LSSRLDGTNVATVYRKTKQRHNDELFKCHSVNDQQTYSSDENSAAEADRSNEGEEFVQADHLSHVKLVLFLWIHAWFQLGKDLSNPAGKRKRNGLVT
jgi:hypothetical protein